MVWLKFNLVFVRVHTTTAFSSIPIFSFFSPHAFLVLISANGFLDAICLSPRDGEVYYQSS